jgi:hypothetical protein
MSSTTPHGAQRIEAESEGPAPLCAAWGEAVALMCEPTPAPALSAQARESLKGLAAREAFLGYFAPAPSPIAPTPSTAPTTAPTAAPTTTAQSSAVDHPAHYHPGAYEAIEVIALWGLDFWAGNAAKYIARAGRKGGAEMRCQDLSKALWYVRDARARERHDLPAPRYIEAGAAFGAYSPGRVAAAWGLSEALTGALYAIAAGELYEAEQGLRAELDARGAGG